MYKRLWGIALFFGLSLPSFSQSQVLPTELQTPQIVEVNREPMRAYGFAFETRELAEKHKRDNSAYFLSLNGTWKFNWVEKPADRPKDFYKEDFNDSQWKNFPVPANWENNGYGLPFYLCEDYEFVGHAKKGAALNPPFDISDDNNPVGSYRKKFTIPKTWDGRQIFIQLGAVRSAFFIWINGKKVGYSEDSKLAAEFDITKYVKVGQENMVALEVYRFSDASYLEDQDMFRFSGIEREVCVFSTPKLNLRDFTVVSLLDKKNYKDGLLRVKAEVNSYKIESKIKQSVADTFKVSVELKDKAGKTVYTQKSDYKTVLGQYKTIVNFETTIPNVAAWSEEIPNLYSLFITLENKKGEVIEVIPQKIGFRTVEIKNGDLLLNGKRIFIKGVCRHEHDPKTAHVVSEEGMRKDIEMMKKLNVNAVRCSHYPDAPYWLDLCDEYGMLIIDEANLESHGRTYPLDVTLANDKVWNHAHIQRIMRMYERDKNRACVIGWSMGNEAGNGCNFYEAYDKLKAADSTRTVQYERSDLAYNTDMYVPMYPTPDDIIKYSKSNPPRPLIMCEYAHIMGNGMGNMKDYWDIIESHPHLQGGFIWEWVDQNIDTVKNGKRIKAYGGDFPLSGPVPENLSDNNFSVKGVVTAYREMTPMSQEVKRMYQYVKMKPIDNGKGIIEIKNNFFHRNLENYTLSWDLMAEGVSVEKGKIENLNLAPQEAKQFTLGWKANIKPDREYFVALSYKLKKEEPFLPAGYEIAIDQFKVFPPIEYSTKPDTLKTAALKVTQTDKAFTATGKDFVINFDLEKGILTSYEMNKEKVLWDGPQPNFWRAPVDNDFGSDLNKKMRIWKNAVKESKVLSAKVNKIADNTYQIVIEKELLKGDATTKQVFTIFGNGNIKVDNSFKAIKGDYPFVFKIGTNMKLNKKFENLRWYGRGPWESTTDRKTSTLIAIWKQKLKDQYYPYARPQDGGNRTDFHWVELTNDKGKGLKFECTPAFHFCAIPYSIDDLDPEVEKKQYHSEEMVERPEIYFNLDYQQTGVGGIDSWGALPMEKYRVKFKNYDYTYWIEPIR